MLRRITVYMLALLLCSASTARASLIQWQLNGIVSANGGPMFGLPFDSIPVGMPAIFDFSFNTDLPNLAQGCAPNQGLYDPGNAGWLSLAGRQYNAHLFIESPLRDHKGLRSSLGGLFDTHPPLEDRIARLAEAGGFPPP